MRCFIDPETTKAPPGMASTSTPKFGEALTSGGRSLWTTGRSFTTESSPRPCTRRPRTTSPVRLSFRSGVSKKYTWRM